MYFVSALFKVLLLRAFSTQLRHKNGVSCSATPASMLTANAVSSYSTSAAICFSSVLITQDSHNSLWRHITTRKHRLPVEIITPAMMFSSPEKDPLQASSAFLFLPQFTISLSALSTFRQMNESGEKTGMSWLCYRRPWPINHDAWKEPYKCTARQ